MYSSAIGIRKSTSIAEISEEYSSFAEALKAVNEIIANTQETFSYAHIFRDGELIAALRTFK